LLLRCAALLKELKQQKEEWSASSKSTSNKLEANIEFLKQENAVIASKVSLQSTALVLMSYTRQEIPKNTL